MKELHEDRALFGQLIQETARAQGIETLYVEKDYGFWCGVGDAA